MSRRPVINITTTPQGWPAWTGARRHSNTDSARFAFSSKAPPRVCCKPYPPLESIKGEGKELSRGTNNGGRTNKTDISPTSEINISSNTPLYSFFKTWDRLPLSQLVTPTQALRCKKIQYSPFSAGRRAFFCPNQDKPPCILFASPFGVGSTQHKFTRRLRALPGPNTDAPQLINKVKEKSHWGGVPSTLFAKWFLAD
jgi:hypothetical protein